MTALIVGGSKSGKSSLAQEMAVSLAGDGPLYYLATMVPRDGEDRARIARHLEDRAGLGFVTVEQGKNLPGCLARADRKGTFLLDSVTALLTNEFFPPERDYAPDDHAGQRVGDDILSFSHAVRHLVVVADDLFRDAAQYDEATEGYRQALGDILCRVADRAELVVEMTMGNPVVHKGVLNL